MSTVAITVNGVLRKVVGGQPIPIGLSLYYGLATQFTVILLADVRDEKDELSNWLFTEGLTEHALVLYPDVLGEDLPIVQRRLAQVVDAGTQAFDVVMVVEPDPDACELLYANGYSVMAFLHQQYMLPTWRPDFNKTPHEVMDVESPHAQLAKPWENLMAEVKHEAELRAKDHRLKQNE